MIPGAALIEDPVLRGLLALLPPSGEPFPKLHDWLELFSAWLDYHYPPPPLAQRPPPEGWGKPICPKCGGPKGIYSVQCIRCNRGTPGNRGGVGGDTRPPAVRETIAEAQATGGPVLINPSDLSDTDRQQLTRALRNGASPGRLVEITAAKPPATPDMRSAGIEFHPPGITYCPEPGCGKRCRAGWNKCKKHRGEPGRKPVAVVGAWPATVTAGQRVRPKIPKYDRCPDCRVNTKLETDERCPRCQALREMGVRPAGVRAG